MSIVTISSHQFVLTDLPTPAEHVGPVIPMDFKIWQILVDYSKWSQWMDDVYDVTLNDPVTSPSGDFGRGSLFHLYGEAGVRTLEILHWSPCQKLVYSITSSHSSVAHCYEIHFFPERSQASITISGEVEVKGIKRLVSFFISQHCKKILGHQSQRLLALVDSRY